MPALRKRTRVCFPFVGDSLGGSHMSTLLLIEGLAQSRYEPVLVVHEEGPLTAHLKARDIPCELLPLPTYAGDAPNVISIAADMLRNVPRLAGFMRRHGIDIVHGNDFRMNLTWSAGAKLTGRPFVWHQRAMPYSSSLRWRDQSVGRSRHPHFGGRRSSDAGGRPNPDIHHPQPRRATAGGAVTGSRQSRNCAGIGIRPLGTRDWICWKAGCVETTGYFCDGWCAPRQS